jgi:RNA polymerase sigma-70 factor, ECF subfamily
MDIVGEIVDIPDDVFVRKVQAGDKDAFGVLVERYVPKLTRYGRRFVSDEDECKDVLQDVFLSAYEHIQSFDASRAFSPWIYRIAHNAFVNTLRKRRTLSVSFFDLDILFPHAVMGESLSEEVMQKEEREHLLLYVDRLPEKYRSVVLLHYFEELEYQEIADVLHIPISTVGVRLVRARAMLKSYYQENKPHAS